MRFLKDLANAILALFAALMVAISGNMLRDDRALFLHSPRALEDFVYPVLLVASVIFLHCFLWRELVPLQHLDPAVRRRIQDGALLRYRKGFFRGGIVLGYVLLAFYVLEFLVPPPEQPSKAINFTTGAIVFIGIGLIARIHYVIVWLLDPATGLINGLKGKSDAEPTVSVDVLINALKEKSDADPPASIDASSTQRELPAH